MSKAFNKLFVNNAWTIGYRKISSQHVDVPEDNSEKKEYKMLPVSDRYYYADPFVYEDGSNVYLFAEMMDRHRGIGTIAVSELTNGEFGKFREVLREPFHVSYPNVFKYENSVYMIPESSANKEIRLYKAVEFPNVWQLEKVVLSGAPYVDTSIVVNGDILTLYTYYIDERNEKHSEKYLLNLSNGNIVKDKNCILINERPAGNPIKIDNAIIRPLQDCDDYYGKGIIWAKESDGHETQSGYLSFGNYQMIPKYNNVTGTHTINRSEHYEVIDIRFDKVCLSKQFIRVINRLKRGKNK